MEINESDKKLVEQLVEQLKEASNSLKATASEINIVAINAAIETAHAASGIRAMMENSLNNTMTTNCRMLAKLLESGSFSLDPEEIDRFAKWVGVDEIFITDGDGITVGSNTAIAIGWRFPDDPNAQAYVFRALIGQKEGVITQPISIRDLDSQMYKYVGISRTDQPGIVQIGFRAETIMGLEAETSAVFGILAQEIKHLEGKVIEASKMVRVLSKTVETGN